MQYEYEVLTTFFLQLRLFSVPCANPFFVAQRFQMFMDRPYAIIPHNVSDRETFGSRPTDGQRKRESTIKSLCESQLTLRSK